MVISLGFLCEHSTSINVLCKWRIYANSKKMRQLARFRIPTCHLPRPFTSQEFCLNDIALKRMCSIQTVEAALSTLSIHYQFMASTHFLSIHQSINLHIFINQSILMYNTKNDSLDQIYDINSLWEILVGEDNREHRFFVWISWFSRFLCGINRVSELS